MTFSTLRRAFVLGAALVALPAAAQTTFTVNSTADDSNARDAMPGDGVCVDGFTGSNPDAEPRCTLRAAIDEANATSGAVIINLPGQLTGGASGSYTLSRTAPNMMSATFEDDNAFGDLDLGGDFSSLTIRGTGTPGPQVTIGPNDRVFDLLSGEVTIERVTITGGTAQPGDNGVSNPGMMESVDGANGADGGCVQIADGVTATLDQVSINNCATSSGGNGAAPASGIARSAGGDAGNGGNGGGIANFGTLTLRKSFVAQNGTGDAGSAGNGTAGDGGTAAGGNGGNGGNGGGIYNAGTLTVEQSTIFDNTAGDPSAGATGTNGGTDGADGEGGSGGGIASLDGGSVELSGSIVADNSAGDDVNNPETGSGPSATKQPGSDLFDGTPADDDDVADGFAAFTPGTFTDGGFNLIGTNDTVEDTFAAGMLIGTGQGDASTRIDPVISGSNRNETYAVTAYELGSGSPAINAGDPAIGQDMVTIDGRGFRRPGTASGDDTADIGAFEFDSTPVMGQLVINELDSVTAPSGEDDNAEFVEIRNTGMFTAQLADYALVFFSGENDQSYAAIDLEGTLAPGETITVGDAMSGASQTPDFFSGTADDVRDEDGAVGIYLGGSTDYQGAAAGQNTSTRVDVLVYDNGTQASRRRDAGSLAGAFGQTEDQIATGDTDANSIQRNANGSFSAGPPTPNGNTMSGAQTDVVINEVDAAPGASEFVELWDGGRGNTDLTGLVLVGINGGDDLTYTDARLELTGTTNADGYYVVGNVAGADASFPGGLQDGPDAIALYQGAASDFPNDTDPSTVTNTLIDVVVYGPSIDQELLDAIPSQDGVYATGASGPRAVKVQYKESFNGTRATQSLQRINDDSRTDGYSLLFYAADPTPGAVNITEVTVNKTDDVADVAGWRMLSSPVINSGRYDAPANTPLRVDFYAENINLVQGASEGNPASLYQRQYPGADDIMFDRYVSGENTYEAVTGTGDELAPGTGFYWYWFDNDVVPNPSSFGGGTSRSFDLDGSTGFELEVIGLPLDDRIASSALGTMGLQVTKTTGEDGFVMLGNPYAYPYSVDGFGVDQGTLSTVFSAWDPEGEEYVVITADAAVPPSDQNAAAIWQGLFAEVSDRAETSVTFSAPSSAVVPTLEGLDGIYRTADADVSEGRLKLALSGTTTGGLVLNDGAAMVRFLDGGTDGWDRHDGSKLTPITDVYALISPTGTRDDAPRRQSALSLPTAFGVADVPLALTAPAGSYAITWEGQALPDGFSGVLVDGATGARSSLGVAGSYEFVVADDTDWTDRFTLAMNQTGVDAEAPVNGVVEVSAAYPNPTAQAASIDLRVAQAQPVKVELFDALGRRVSLAHSGGIAAGQRLTVNLPTADLAPGVYVIRVAGEGFQESRRLTVIR